MKAFEQGKVTNKIWPYPITQAIDEMNHFVGGN
jgi:hypothetical protein